MNADETALLIAAIEEICADGADWSPTRVGEFDASSWRQLERLSFTLVPVPEHLGGGGGTLEQASAITRAVGRLGLAVPLAETMWLAGWMLGASKSPVPSGPLTAAKAEGSVSLTRVGGGWQLDGVLRRVPWAEAADLIVGLVPGESGPKVVKLRPEASDVRVGLNLAGEQRCDVICHETELTAAEVIDAGPDVTPEQFDHRAALSRAIAMSGAAEQVLALAVAQAKEREQFGRPLARFQAVQQLLAQLAAETVAVVVAAQAAVLALEHGTPEDAAFAIAAAKASSSASAGSIAAWGHQVLGALGFTIEHPLHRSTRRLWAWREEFGNEREHHIDLAAQALANDPWNLIVARTAEPGLR